MSIIRSKNAYLNDTMRDVIGDLSDRAALTGLEPIGIFETFKALQFDGEPAATLGILPEELYAIATDTNKANPGEVLDVSQITFYGRSNVGMPNMGVKRIVRLSLMDSNLSKMSLTVALYFFLERGWFRADTPEGEKEKIAEWAQRHFNGYEHIAEDLYAIVYRLLVEKRKDDGKLEHPFDLGAYKVE